MNAVVEVLKTFRENSPPPGCPKGGARGEQLVLSLDAARYLAGKGLTSEPRVLEDAPAPAPERASSSGEVAEARRAFEQTEADLNRVAAELSRTCDRIEALKLAPVDPSAPEKIHENEREVLVLERSRGKLMAARDQLTKRLMGAQRHLGVLTFRALAPQIEQARRAVDPVVAKFVEAARSKVEALLALQAEANRAAQMANEPAAGKRYDALDVLHEAIGRAWHETAARPTPVETMTATDDEAEASAYAPFTRFKVFGKGRRA